MQVAGEANVVTPVCTVLCFLEMSAVPAVSVFSCQRSAAYTHRSACLYLPVVCKKLSCPQGSSRRGALMGAGAEGCSAYVKCESVKSKATREKVMTRGMSLSTTTMSMLLYWSRRAWLVTLMNTPTPTPGRKGRSMHVTGLEHLKLQPNLEENHLKHSTSRHTQHNNRANLTIIRLDDEIISGPLDLHQHVRQAQRLPRPLAHSNGRRCRITRALSNTSRGLPLAFTQQGACQWRPR